MNAVSKLFLLTLLLLATVASLFGCSMCADKPGPQASSPDKLLAEVTTYRNCGARTSEYTKVTLQPSADNHRDITQIIFTVRYHQDISLSWKDSSELIVNCTTCVSKDIELQTTKFRSVTITCVLGPAA